jgi:hypothetical protein
MNLQETTKVPAHILCATILLMGCGGDPSPDDGEGGQGGQADYYGAVVGHRQQFASPAGDAVSLNVCHAREHAGGTLFFYELSIPASTSRTEPERWLVYRSGRRYYNAGAWIREACSAGGEGGWCYQVGLVDDLLAYNVMKEPIEAGDVSASGDSEEVDGARSSCEWTREEPVEVPAGRYVAWLLVCSEVVDGRVAYLTEQHHVPRVGMVSTKFFTSVDGVWTLEDEYTWEMVSSDLVPVDSAGVSTACRP